jgi:electron transfer flavoprotein alpha subunit
VTEGNIEFTSKLFGGKILTDVHLTDNQGIVNIYPGAFPADPGRSDKPAEVTALELTLPDVKISFTEYLEVEKTDVDITVKDVLVGVGRGFQSEDELEIASELAETVNGAVCASRPVVDQEWLPMNRQVGKSGMIVKPKLYIAAGISGAPEHVEGMQNSETVIAINTDPEAPIFSVSDYGVCGDLNDILPALTEEIKNRQK